MHHIEFVDYAKLMDMSPFFKLSRILKVFQCDNLYLLRTNLNANYFTLEITTV